MTPHLELALGRLGFAREGQGDAYRNNGTLFLPDGAWSVLRATAPQDADPLQDQLGKPGLWKLAGGVDGRPVHPVFELPPPPEPDDPPEDDAAFPLEACLAWAQHTRHSAVGADWAPPPRAEIDGWLTVGALVVRCGALVRQVQLVHEPGRLALRCPIVPCVPADLPAARRVWLRALLAEGQERWRLVRIGLSASPGGQAALAEVDLSGAPAAVVECLFRAGLAALRGAVEGLVQPAVFLADAAVSCRALEVCPVAGLPRERSVTS